MRRLWNWLMGYPWCYRIHCGKECDGCVQDG